MVVLGINSRANEITNNSFLSKPTGEYGVGFKDFHWINKNICPDPMYTGKNKSDFSKNNSKYCHEIVARVYYPIFQQMGKQSDYYRPFLKVQKERLSQIPGITTDEIAQLDQIKSYSNENSYPTLDKKFPVVFFSPGYGCSIELYENFITEIVSHGYIVIGVNSPFISGDVELPNKHIVQSTPVMDVDEVLKKFLPIQKSDLSFVFQKINKEHNSNLIFSSMDLRKIGAFGHSLGALVITNLTKLHPHWFQAAATFDVGGNSTITKFEIPFMHQISSSFMQMVPVDFELGANGYVVSISPSEDKYDYSYHMNFSDMSTLQYLPAYQKVAAYLDQVIKVGCDIKFISHDLTKEEISTFNKTTYVLIKKQNKWSFSYYEGPEKISDINTSMIKSLDEELKKLPDILPEKFTEAEIMAVKNILMHVFIINHTQYGKGNGWKLTSSINIYLLHFLDAYLKGQEDSALKNCNKLTDDTLIRCN